MIIDIIFLIVAGWGFYQGYTRGIIKTVLTVFSVVFGLMVALKLTPAATKFLETAFHTTSAFTFIGGFLLVFVLTMVIIRMIAQFFEKALKTAHINFINKAAGGILLASLYILIYSALVWFGDSAHLIKDETRKSSKTYVVLKEFPKKMEGVYNYVKPGFQDFWHESVKFMDKLEVKSIEQSEATPTIFDIPDDDSKRPDQ